MCVYRVDVSLQYLLLAIIFHFYFSTKHFVLVQLIRGYHLFCLFLFLILLLFLIVLLLYNHISPIIWYNFISYFVTIILMHNILLSFLVSWFFFYILMPLFFHSFSILSCLPIINPLNYTCYINFQAFLFSNILFSSDIKYIIYISIYTLFIQHNCWI